MKIIFTILALISLLYAQTNNELDDITEEDVPKILSIIKEGTKENLPIILDEYTTVFDVTSLQNAIEYKNNINSLNEHIKTILKTDKNMLFKTIFENNKNYLCNDPETYLLLKKGAVFIYSFYDLNNLELFKFSIQKKDCR